MSREEAKYHPKISNYKKCRRNRTHQKCCNERNKKTKHNKSIHQKGANFTVDQHKSNNDNYKNKNKGKNVCNLPELRLFCAFKNLNFTTQQCIYFDFACFN